MKLIATIYETLDMEWRIHVNPRGTRNEVEEHRPIISFWSPNGKHEERMLIYNPKIALVGRVKKPAYAEETVYIQINQLYAFANKLSQVYQGLSAANLKKRDGNHLYIDQSQALKTSQKMNLYNKSLVITPSILTIHDSEVIGVQFTVGGKFAGSMPHTDIRELCEILTHTDVQVYSLVLSLLEKLDDMDQKLDKIIAMQSELLGVIKSNQIQARTVRVADPAGNFQWQHL